jgi:4-diphosphocytidyl-2-C-methyl-D-erythritol kinase
MSPARDSVRIEAPAKVNLRLRVLGREASGYHALETIFCAISLADVVEVRCGEAGIRLAVEGDVDTGPPERNLAFRAAERFYRELGEEPAVDVRLAKAIPSAAGLGGGSSDAAATLAALNALHDRPVARADLLRMAVELGADVPFFLCGSPLALAWGRGERLLVLPPLPSYPVLVAHPGESMPTTDAFRALAALRGSDPPPESDVIDADALATWSGVAGLARNDFEPVVFERIPVLRDALREMRMAGAAIAMLAGSGSSLFGVFDFAADRDAAAERCERLGMRCWRTETLARMPAPRVDFRGPNG